MRSSVLLRVALAADRVGSATAIDIPNIWKRAGEAVIVLASGNDSSHHPVTTIMIVTRLIALTAVLVAGSAAPAADDRDVERIVSHDIRAMLSSAGEAGAAVAVRIDGRNLFFNYGFADRAAQRSITEDSLFNLASLRKVFETTLLAQAVGAGELDLDDPVSKYVTELQHGGDIR